jgi:CheY-like chemotaxis protein
MEILMVEDSLMFARITMGALRNANIQHRMTWLTDGEEALAFLRREGRFAHAPRPDLVLLDLGLPGRDGREVLADLRGDADLATLPVVVMTASTEEDDVRACEELDVEQYLVKPVDLAKFLNVVQELKRFWHEDMIVPTLA